MAMSSSTDTSLFLVRTTLLCCFAGGIIEPQLFQPYLNTLYTRLLCSNIYQSSTFETFWTVLNYGIFETYYTILYFRNPYSRLAVINDVGSKTRESPPKPPHGMTRIQNRLPDVLAYIAPLLLLDLTMIKKFADVPVSDMAVSGNYDPDDHSNVGSSFLRPTLHNFTIASPLQTHRALPLDAPSSRRMLLELVVSLVIYDLTFFLFHLSLHRFPVLRIRRLHTRHHAHAEMHPQITNRLDIVERMGLVLLANFSLNIIAAHVLTRTVFVTLFTGLLVQIHSGLNLEWGYDKILPRGWGTGASKHAIHHREGERYFAPFFGWCDRALESALSLKQKSQ